MAAYIAIPKLGMSMTEASEELEALPAGKFMARVTQLLESPELLLL